VAHAAVPGGVRVRSWRAPHRPFALDATLTTTIRVRRRARPKAARRDNRDAAVQLPRTGHTGMPQQFLVFCARDADTELVRCTRASCVGTCAIVDGKDTRPENGEFPFRSQAHTAALSGRCRKAKKHCQGFRCSILWDEDMIV
jgi:hypothetical protein